jgi:hypothetical protein
VTAPLAPFTPAQETRLAAIEAAPHDEASTVERVARALWETVDDWPWEKASPEGQAYARRQAVAALAAMSGRDDAAQAVARVEALADVLAKAPGNGPNAAALIFGALAGGDKAKIDTYEARFDAAIAGDGVSGT